MSRIHDALKKAEQDRATTQVTDIGALPQQVSAVTAAPAWEESVATAPAEVVPPAEQTATKAVAPPTACESRFDDLRAHCAQPRWHVDTDASVFANPALSPQAAEQFRTLRSRLYHLQAHQTLRTILITSAIPREGKTWVTSNLAQAIVRQADRRALVIDADLRASRLHSVLGAPLSPGLTEYLKGEADETQIIQHGADGNLWFIPGGSQVTNPSELLSNGRMKTLLERVAPLFDWVLIDSPPCLSVADAGILAAHCDGILVVVRAGQTPAAMAQKSRQELQGRNVIGVVLNAVEQAPKYGSSYHYGYGNGNGSGRGTAQGSRN